MGINIGKYLQRESHSIFSQINIAFGNLEYDTLRKITAEDSGTFIQDLGFSQGDDESATTTTVLNFDDTDRPEPTGYKITNKHPSTRELNLSTTVELEPLVESVYGSDGGNGPW